MGPPEDYKYTGEKPLNREPSPSKLVSSFITSTKLAYDRNHSPIPRISAEKHTVKVTGLVSRPQTLSVHALEKDFPQHTVTSLLQCAGNRRHTMRTAIKEVDGVDWYDGAVMNCTWTGPRLCDILLKAGVDKSKGKHVAFACYQTDAQDDSWYGGSIPLERAMRESADVILALKQNGELLTPEHGFPVRVVTPGILGARAVKWLDEIVVQDEECENFYQQRDYKILPPEAVNKEEAKKFWDKVPSLTNLPINSAVGSPCNESTITRDENGMIEVKGYALPGGEDGPVVKVEVRIDGAEWQEAQLEKNGEDSKWTWRLWKWKGVVQPGKRTIWSKATDKGGNTQTSERSEWNLRGVAYNGYGEANVEVF